MNQLWGIINDFKNSFSTCKLMYRVVHRRSTPPELFRYCMILKDLVFEFISKSSRKIQQGCRIGTPNFWQSVNPILSRGNRLCPPHYNCDLQIFAPSGIPDGTYQTKVSWLKCLIPFLVIIVNLGRGKRNTSWSKLLLRSEF